MIRFITGLIFSAILSMHLSVDIYGQKNLFSVDSSALAGVPLPHVAIMDKRLFSNAAAKTVLEMETSKYKISINEVEVYSFPNPSGNRENSKLLADTLLKFMMNSGFECQASRDDPSYNWMAANNRKIIMYIMASKNETSLYFGRVDDLPPFFMSASGSIAKSTMKSETTGIQTNSSQSSGTSVYNSSSSLPNNITLEGKKLIGMWGNLSGSKVNYQDGSTGYMIVSGQSRGFGLELRPDGSFLQTTVVTSGRPNYRIYVSTTGSWTTNGNQMIFLPQDRHYRKWENELIMTDEHSVPEQYIMIYNIKNNDITGKECLYVKYSTNQPQWEELYRE